MMNFRGESCYIGMTYYKQSYLGNETLIATLNGRSINSWHSCIRSISGDDTLGSKFYFILGEGEARKSAWVLFYLLYLHQFAQ